MTLPGRAVRREASPSARSRGGVLQRVNRNVKRARGLEAFPGAVFLLRSSLLFGPPALFPLPLFTKYVEDEFSEVRVAPVRRP
jgi:hypothetical protein